MAHQFSYPPNLPVPIDDGACDHLLGLDISPDIRLTATTPASPSDDGYANVPDQLSLSQLSQDGLALLFIYPRTAPPEEDVPAEWNAIPGARGCTPQNCAFRDAYTSLLHAGLPRGHLFGCSTQPPSVHTELSSRLHLPYVLLSDEHLTLQRALTLPTFEYQGRTLIRRLTLAIHGGKIIKVWYPVFPSDKVDDVVDWVRQRKA